MKQIETTCWTYRTLGENRAVSPIPNVLWATTHSLKTMHTVQCARVKTVNCKTVILYNVHTVSFNILYFSAIRFKCFWQINDLLFIYLFNMHCMQECAGPQTPGCSCSPSLTGRCMSTTIRADSCPRWAKNHEESKESESILRPSDRKLPRNNPGNDWNL